MGEVPRFFVPGAKPGKDEEAYADLAKWCGCGVPSSDKRIYSITFVADGEEWTATVGSTLRGVSYRTKRSKGMTTEQKQFLSDPALVWAIFAGAPYQVVTNHRIEANVHSAWENPFLAGIPKSITYFPSTEPSSESQP